MRVTQKGTKRLSLRKKKKTRFALNTSGSFPPSDRRGGEGLFERGGNVEGLEKGPYRLPSSKNGL